MPQDDRVVNLTKCSSQSWLEKGCIASQIMGVAQMEVEPGTGPVICAVVEIDNTDGTLTGAPGTRRELLPTSYLRIKCPQLLIQFYEQKVENTNAGL